MTPDSCRENIDCKNESKIAAIIAAAVVGIAVINSVLTASFNRLRALSSNVLTAPLPQE